MRYRLCLRVLALGALVLLGGCRAATALSYESCSYDSDCQRPSDRCVLLTHSTGGGSARICSSSCSLSGGSSQCPPDRFGSIGACVGFSGGPLQCYQSCSPGSSACEYGTVCTTEMTTGGGPSANICYPPSSGGTALPYETCISDGDCSLASDRCITLAHASGGSTARICSSSCVFGGAQCPTDRYGSVGSCISFDGGSSFQCYQSCSPGSSLCELGTVCTTETTTGGGLSTNICYPPGGSTNAAAYAGCAGGMLCQSGTNCVNVKDNTTVELCTITHCSSDANCPLDRRGGRGACVSLDGDSFGTCVERCNVGSDCTYPSAERCTTVTHNGVSLPLPGVCLP